ncbi:hypothetical protein [Paraburkholderia antibiotica]|nr:hypothetical protein [Paraburkholderia antibiotica]
MNTFEQHWSAELSKNTDATLRVESNTKELVELMQLAKGGIAFFAATGRLLRRLVLWFGPFITVVGALWAIAHGKFPGQT